MLDTVRSLLEQSPMLALFAAIGIGYAVGRISIAGFSLDIGAVLFAGLALGAIAPKAAPPALVSSIGLVMFLYGIGIQYGRQFFAGLGGAGLMWNALGAAGVLCALAVALIAGAAFGVSPAHTLGLFAGALTSTPTLQAAIDVVGDRSPAIGYSVAYPIGIIVPILCIFAFSRIVKPRLAPAPAPPAIVEIVLADTRAGTTVAEITAGLPSGVHIVAVRQGRTNKLPDPQIRLDAGDGLLLFGEPGALDQARQQLGRLESGTVASDRSALDIGRYFVSRAALTGVPIGRMTWPAGSDAKIVEVRRGDTSFVADPELGARARRPRGRDRLASGPAGVAAAFRRFDQIDDRGVVRVGRPGYVVRRAAGPRADSDSGPRPVLARCRRRPARGCARPRQARPNRSVRLALALAGKPDAAHVRPDAVPGGGGSRFGCAVRGNPGERRGAVPGDRGDHHRRGRAGRLPGRNGAPAGNRRPVRRRVGDHRQSGDSRLRQQGAAERSYRRSVCDDLPVDDDSQDPLRAGRARAHALGPSGRAIWRHR